ncbi:MAG: hypothetical protein LBR20_03265 [Propionibacteriaceae bacterium]|nr:hypothetical protein [Propionibacteriaceae bacterium]
MKIPLAFVVGTLGYALGWGLAKLIVSLIRVIRKPKPGKSLYRLGRLAPEEYANAGGKAVALDKLLRAGQPVPKALVLLPRAFDGEALRPEAAAELTKMLPKLGKDALFAVRSSALAEDSAQASFAGAYESVLNVPAAEVAQAVATVRHSAEDVRVGAYAGARGVADIGEVAVVVQKMVAADYAGVLFTADPLTGNLGVMTGNAVAGLGEALVSGAANAFEFRFSRPKGDYTGPEALAPAAKSLHREAHQAEKELGGLPQDLEWAVVGKKVWLLQGRPITTMVGSDPRTGERNDTLAGNCLWSATNLVEANPEPQTPLTITLADYVMAHGGPSVRVRGRQMSGYIGGRTYNNLSVQLAARGPKVAEQPRAELRKLADLWGAVPDAVPVLTLPLSKADLQAEGLTMLYTLPKLLGARRRLKDWLAGSLAACENLTNAVAAVDKAPELGKLWIERVFPAYRESFWSVIAATAESSPIDAEVRALAGPEDAAILLASVNQLAGGLASLGPAAGLQEVLAGRLSRAEYLRLYGHRGYNEVELAWPRPAEDPSWLDAQLAAAGAAAAPKSSTEDFAAALRRLRAAHPKEAKKIEEKLQKRATAAARREAVRSEAIRWLGVVRAFALRAGELLGIGDGVFYLTAEELPAALAGETSAFAYLELRRQTHQKHLELPPLPGLIAGSFDPFAWAADPNRRADYYIDPSLDTSGTVPEVAATDAVIRGVPGAKGVVAGVVRRLDTIAEADQLQPGEILVTHLTNIGWTPVFPRAAAIVTDIGAALSHAAIVARELGVPAVVGCGNATTRLRTGDRVQVDGAGGTVTLINAA